MLFKKQAVHDAWAATERTLDFKVTVKGKNYTATDISSLSYDSGAMNGEALTLGSTYTNTIKITFSHLIEGLALLDEITPQIGIQLPDGTWDFTSLGVFIIDAEVQQDRNNNTTTLSASDRMCMMGGTYESKLSYPAAINDVAVEIANMAGMKVNVDDFARLPTEKILSLGKVTYRDAIGYVAQFAGGFATFDRDGLLDIRVLSDPDFTVTPDQYQSKGLTKNEAFYRIGGLTCSVTTTVKDDSGSETQETTTLQAGSTAGTQIILNNPGMTQTLLDGLYEQLQDLNFYPFSLSWFGDPSLEAGDWITVQDTAGNEFKTPNLLYSLTFGGGVTATSKADTTITASANFVYRGATNQIITNIRRYLNAAGHAISEGIDEPTSPKAGDIWFKKEGPDTTIMTYVIDPETGVGSWHEGPSTKANAELQKLFEDLKEEMKGTSAAASAAVIAGSAAMVAGNQASAAGSAAQSAADSVAAKVVESSKEVAAAKSAAASAVDQASQANANAGFANSQVSLAKRDAASAVTQASTAYSAAKSAVSNAQSAMSAATSATATTKALSSTVDDINGTIKKLATTETVDKLTGTVSSAQALAQMAADGLSAKVTASDVTGMLGNYATQSWSEGKISAAKNEISASVETVKQTVDNLQIGGRNLVLNSDFENPIANVAYVNSGWGGVSVDYSYQGSRSLKVSLDPAISSNDSGVVIRFSNPQSNSTYTATGWLYSNVARTLVISGYSSTWASRGRLPVVLQANTWTKFEYHFTTEISVANAGVAVFVNGTTGNDIQPFYIDLVKIEQANVATNWSPAPEDQATVDWTKSQLDIKDGKISAAVTSLKSDIANATAGMATQTWVNNKVSLTEGGLSADIQKLRTDTTDNIANATAGMATQTWTQGKLDLTADGLTSKISSVQNGLDTKYTSIEETLKGVQITANNAVTQSQYTQLADQITSVIGDPDNLVIGGDFEDQRDYIGQTSPYWSSNAIIVDNGDKNIGNNPSATVLQIPGLLTGNNDVTSRNLIAVSPVEYKFSLKVRWLSATQLGAIIIYAFECDANKTLIAPKVIAQDTRPTAWHTVTGTYTPSSDKVRYIKFGVTYAGAQGTTPIYVDDIRMGLNVATQSQITQLQSDINLRVKTGDLVSQISVNVKGILLDGASTYITNTTHIDTGVIKSANIQDAAITSAKIGALAVTTANIGYAAVTNAEIAALAVGTAQIADGAITNAKIGNASITTAKIGDAQISSAKIISISADKITAGTLDAAKVNVVNLNASNITTGTISGANLSINLTTGEILFQKGTIKSTNGNLNIDIDNGNMEVVNSVGSGFRFQNGGLYLTDKSWSWPTPTYGSITYSPKLFSNIYGIAIKGAIGASLSSNDYDTGSLMGQRQPTSGAAVSLMSNDALLNARERAAVEGGNLYSESRYYPNTSRATIIVGGNNGDGEAPTDQYGKYHLQDSTGVGSDVYIKGTHITFQGGNENGLADLNLGNDGKGYISSAAIYNRTYSSGDHVVITGYGTLGRLTSARKYKIADQVATGIVAKAQRALAISPAEWYDKAEIESIADAKTNGTEAPGEAKIEKHYGFIADDFDAAGLTEVVNYHNGEVDSLSYDHISMYHHVILQNHEKRIAELEAEVKQLKGEI